MVPTGELANGLMRRFGVDVEYYPPLAGAGLQESGMRAPNTTLLCARVRARSQWKCRTCRRSLKSLAPAGRPSRSTNLV